MYFVYILHSTKLSRYYIGQTNNINRRLKYHNSGLGSYTSKGVPWILLWYTEKSTRSEAIILEKKLKNLSQKRLQVFMNKYKEDMVSPDDASMSG